MTATVSFRTADGEEIQAETVVLTAMSSSATRVFTAPVTAGTYTLAVSGQVEETDDLRVTVTGASTSVTAEPVALMLRLRGPEGAVTVGQTYTVTVDTAEPVPAGTTLAVTVTVSAGTGGRRAGAADSRYSQHAGFLHGTGAGGLRDGDGDGAGRDEHRLSPGGCIGCSDTDRGGVCAAGAAGAIGCS